MVRFIRTPQGRLRTLAAPCKQSPKGDYLHRPASKTASNGMPVLVPSDVHMRPAVKILTAKNEQCHRRTYGTHRLTIVCLIRRKVQTAGTYRPKGRNVHRLPAHLAK